MAFIKSAILLLLLSIAKAPQQQVDLTQCNWQADKIISRLNINDTLTLKKFKFRKGGLLSFKANDDLEECEVRRYCKEMPLGGTRMLIKYDWHKLGTYTVSKNEITITTDSITRALKPVFTNANSIRYVVTGMGKL